MLIETPQIAKLHSLLVFLVWSALVDDDDDDEVKIIEDEVTVDQWNGVVDEQRSVGACG